MARIDVHYVGHGVPEEETQKWRLDYLIGVKKYVQEYDQCDPPLTEKGGHTTGPRVLKRRHKNGDWTT